MQEFVEMAIHAFLTRKLEQEIVKKLTKKALLKINKDAMIA